MLIRPSLGRLFGSLRVRIALTTVVLVGVAAVVGGVYTTNRFRDARDAAVTADADALVRGLLAGGALEELDRPDALKRHLARLRRLDSRLRAVQVMRGGGSEVVAAAGPAAPRRSPPARARREALAAYGDARDRVAPADQPDGSSLIVLHRPLRDGRGRRVATARLVLDRSAVEAEVAREARRVSAVAGALTVVLAVVLGSAIWRCVFVPLGRLRAAIGEIREGSIGTRLDWRRGDELGDLARDFDAMADELQETQTSLQFLALHDPLTGLLNHRSFHEGLREAVESARSDGGSVAVVAVDLDHFKLINDTHGHPYGDDMLAAAARQLVGQVREGDLAARIGGEEFAIILAGADCDDAYATAERVRAAIAEVVVAGSRPLGSSAGVASFPLEASDAATLLQLADAALYEAKSAGRGRTCRYDDARPALAVDDQRAEIEVLLGEPDALEMVFQPWVELTTGRVAGYEALARFAGSPTRTPDVWFAQARRCGLGAELEALAVCRALECAPAPDGGFISVNLSPSALLSPAVCEALPTNLARVVIEITEHEQIVASRAFQDALATLRRRGARIALDDAGAGYAGLEQLMRLRPDVIKLDRSLIADVPDQGSIALIEALVRFAHRIEATVCAEGVETAEQLIALGDLDVSYGQGYHLARPGPQWPQLPAAVQDRLRGRESLSRRPDQDPDGAHDTADRRLEAACAAVSRCSSQEELGLALELAASELAADEVSLAALDADGGSVEIVCVTSGWPSQEVGAVRDYPATETVLREQQVQQVQATDPEADAADVAFLTSNGFGAVLLVPVMASAESVGLLEVARHAERPFTRSQINRALVVGYQLGTLVQARRASMSSARRAVRYRGSQRLART